MFAAWTDRTPCFCVRAIASLCLWSVVSGASLADLAVGLVVACGAAWASMCLLPCWRKRPSLTAWIELTLRIPFQALVAGTDVARRALAPALPLRPGFISYSTDLPEGTAQNAFAAFAALQPGSVPVRSATEGIFDIHCLDIRLPIATTLEMEEARLRVALGLGQSRG